MSSSFMKVRTPINAIHSQAADFSPTVQVAGNDATKVVYPLRGISCGVLFSGEVEVTDDEAGLNAVGFLREGASFGERSWLMGTLRKNNYR